MTTYGATKLNPGNNSSEIQRAWFGSQDPTQCAISGDFVIEFARLRINQINSSLTRQLEQMRQGAKQSTAINEALADLAIYAEGFPNGDDAKYAGVKGAIDKAAKSLPESSPMRAKLESLRDDGNSPLNWGNDNKVSKEEMTKITKELENALKDNDRSMQELQLYVQKDMGLLNEVSQLAAMLLQKMQDCIDGIQKRS